MKLRYFRWIDGTGNRREVVVSGSFNPEDTAAGNDDTLMVVDGQSAGSAAVIARYRAAYNVRLFLFRFACMWVLEKVV